MDLGAIWKGFISSVYMPNMKCLSFRTLKINCKWDHYNSFGLIDFWLSPCNFLLNQMDYCNVICHLILRVLLMIFLVVSWHVPSFPKSSNNLEPICNYVNVKCSWLVILRIISVTRTFTVWETYAANVNLTNLTVIIFPIPLYLTVYIALFTLPLSIAFVV